MVQVQLANDYDLEAVVDIFYLISFVGRDFRLDVFPLYIVNLANLIKSVLRYFLEPLGVLLLCEKLQLVVEVPEVAHVDLEIFVIYFSMAQKHIDVR